MRDTFSRWTIYHSKYHTITMEIHTAVNKGDHKRVKVLVGELGSDSNDLRVREKLDSNGEVD